VLAEVGECFLDEEEGDDGVDLEHLPEEGRVGALEIARSDDGGIVDDGIETAEALDREGDKARRTSLVGKILDVEDGAVGTDLRDGLLAKIPFEPVDDDTGAFGGALLRDRFADAGATAGDEDDFVGEAHLISDLGLRIADLGLRISDFGFGAMTSAF
jgi:hypothetical protein